MNLSQLRFVKALVELRSFSKAAQHCCVTQPTLSNAVAQLERELGGALFVRTTRSVALAPFGERLAPLIVALAEGEQELRNAAKAFFNPAHQLIRVGMSPLINTQLLATLIEPFRRDHAGIEFVFKECFQDDLKLRLGANQIDLALRLRGQRRKGWESCKLYQECLGFLPKDEAVAQSPRQDAVTLKEVSAQTFAMTAGGCGLAGAVRDLFRRQRLKLHEYPGQALSYQVLQEWAGLGIAAAILPESKIAADNRGARRLLVNGKQAAVLTYEAVWKKDSAQIEHLGAFLDHLRHRVPAILSGLAPSNMRT